MKTILKIKKSSIFILTFILSLLLIFLIKETTYTEAITTVVPSLPAVSITSNTEVKLLKRVLLINSYDQNYKWTFELTQAIKEKLDESGLEYNLQVENMDTKRVNNATSIELLLNQFKYKFSNFKYDIVLLSDDDAFNFVLKYRDQLFPDVPVVFSGVNSIQNRIEVLDGQKLITGVNEDVDIEASLDIALKLQPEVKNIYFIHDNTTTGKIVSSYIEKILPKYKSKYNVTIYDGNMSAEEILSNIKNISPNSLIYLTLFTQDKDKKYYNFDELLKMMRSMTDVPIFGTWSWSLGDGIVGGKLTSGRSQGLAMTDITIRVLKGEDINKIPILLESPNIYAFDYKEMIAHNSIIKNVPPGSMIINQPESFYVKYKEYIWLSIATLILLIFLIVILVIKNRFNKLKLAQSVVEQEKLEKMVLERTTSVESSNKKLNEEVENKNKIEEELYRSINKLETFNKLMIDREMKIIELKKKITELEEKKI